MILDPEAKPRTVNHIDAIISAEIPDPQTHPKLYETISQCMVHGPCGSLNPNAPCMIDGKCSKRFPKSFTTETILDDNHYPTYRRQNNGRSISVGNYQLDNHWIVPYNGYLSGLYNCHINVEICSSITAVKYLFKYVYKGFDRAIVEISNNNNNGNTNENDEIRQYLDARYISAPEAAWRIFGFKMHAEYPPVQHLQMHEENQQFVHFSEDQEIDDILQQAASKDTPLTAWFKLNQTDPNAHQYTYPQIPTHYTWNKKLRQWTARKKGYSIGRMFFASPSQGEHYFLRMLLTKVSGATGFEILHTFENRVYNTYCEACIA